MHLAHARLLDSQDASGTSGVINQQGVSLAASTTWRMCYQARALPSSFEDLSGQAACCFVRGSCYYTRPSAW